MGVESGMRFPFPLLPAEFEIPDDWWAEAGMAGFVPTRGSYRSRADAIIVRLRDVEPPSRLPECLLDFKGFSRDRMVRVLSGFVTDAEIEPVTVAMYPPVDLPPAIFRYRVWDGVHRFYASVAAGFEYLPVVVP